MKVLADESVSRSTMVLLQQYGHEVESVHDAQLAGSPDPDLVQYAIQHKRTILTLDKDFGTIYYLQAQGQVGVILVRTKPQTVENVNRELEAFLKTDLPNQIIVSTSLIVLKKGKVRIMRPPV